MRRMLILLLLAAILLPHSILSATKGKIKGKVIDRESGEALLGANIVVAGTSSGATSNVNGEYTILNLEAGVYQLKASYVGYQLISISNVRVNSDLTTEIDFKLSAEGVQLTAVTIVAERPLVDRDHTNTIRIQSSDEINALPIRGVANVAGLQASVVQNEGSNLLYIRGGRPEEVSYLVDGVSVNNPLTGTASTSFTNMNQNALEEMQIQTGGFNAEYGSAMSGVVNVTTKQAYTKYTGSAEIITDGFLSEATADKSGAWGYNVFNFSAGGPVVPNSDLVGLFLSGELQSLKDNDPRSVGGVKTNSKTSSFNMSGKLTIKPAPELDIKVGGMSYTRNGNSWDNFRRFQNADHQQKFDNSTLSSFARLTHNVGTNLYYTIQLNYFDEKLMSGDGKWFDDILSYGSKAKNPELAQDAVNPQSVFSTIAGPGTVLDRFGKSEAAYYGATGDVNLQQGNHLFKVGGEYRTHVLRRYYLNPMTLALGATGSSQDADWQRYRDANVEYYGYSYDGKSTYDGSDKYFDNPTNNKNEAPKKPVYAAAYVQDKVELSDLVLNLGLRLDYFNANERVVKDPFNPFGARGTAGGGVFDAKDLRASKATTTVSPRLGFSFPITNKAVFHAQYGTFLQMPPLQDVLISKTWEERYMGGAAGFSTRIPNPDLKPERTVSYEMGFRQLITDNTALSITGFYKEIKDLIQARNIGSGNTPAYPSGYETFENVDFGTVKGIDFIFEMRRTRNIAVTLNYTLGYASGTGSDPNTQSRISWIQTENPKIVSPLDFDRRHTGSLNVDYRLAAGDGPTLAGMRPLERTGVVLLFTFNSGVPYTRSIVYNPFFGGVTEVRPTGAINQAYTPWNARFDLKVDRGFSLGPVNLIASLSVLNVLNTKNVFGSYRGPAEQSPLIFGNRVETSNGIYRGTGEADNSGWLATKDGQDWAAKNGDAAVQIFKDRENDPSNFGIPRQIRLGVRVEY